jgi:putative addiction module antidote
MVHLKVQKFGDSLGVILPNEVLGKLNLHEGQSVFLAESPDGAIRISATDPALEHKMAVAKDIAKRYRNTLRELAK